MFDGGWLIGRGVVRLGMEDPEFDALGDVLLWGEGKMMEWRTNSSQSRGEMGRAIDAPDFQAKISRHKANSRRRVLPTCKSPLE